MHPDAVPSCVHFILEGCLLGQKQRVQWASQFSAWGTFQLDLLLSNPFCYCNVYIEKACENYVIIKFFAEHLVVAGVRSIGARLSHGGHLIVLRELISQFPLYVLILTLTIFSSFAIFKI